MATPRAHRTIQQWACSFLRYAPIAVGSEQMTWGTALAHMSTVFHVSENAKQTRESQLLGVVYDALVREAWARRALAVRFGWRRVHGSPPMQLPGGAAAADRPPSAGWQEKS